MVAAPPKPRPGKSEGPDTIPAPRTDKPWHQYRREPNWKLLEPGWAGQVDEAELAYILEHLKADDSLSYWWGFRPGQKTRSEAATRRIALDGDPDSRANNVRLARTNSKTAKSSPESPSVRTKK